MIQIAGKCSRFNNCLFLSIILCIFVLRCFPWANPALTADLFFLWSNCANFFPHFSSSLICHMLINGMSLTLSQLGGIVLLYIPLFFTTRFVSFTFVLELRV